MTLSALLLLQEAASNGFANDLVYRFNEGGNYMWPVLISLIIGLTSWMEVSRIVRAQVSTLKEMDFVQASRGFGASNWRIMLVELLPNIAAPVLVAATLKVATAVLMESYISFLGYGVQPPMASWGNMLTNAQGYFDTVPFLAILPGILITFTVMGFNFLGDGLRDAVDARLKIDP